MWTMCNITPLQRSSKVALVAGSSALRLRFGPGGRSVRCQEAGDPDFEFPPTLQNHCSAALVDFDFSKQLVSTYMYVSYLRLTLSLSFLSTKLYIAIAWLFSTKGSPACRVAKRTLSELDDISERQQQQPSPTTPD